MHNTDKLKINCNWCNDLYSWLQQPCRGWGVPCDSHDICDTAYPNSDSLDAGRRGLRPLQIT